MEEVLSPWTPVLAKPSDQGIDVRVWGRTYRIAGSALPTSIVTAREEVLYAPIRLAGTADGKPIAWQRSGAFLLKREEPQAVLCGWQSSETLTVNTTITVEFDGMARVDMVLLPNKDASPRIDELRLEVPLARKRAALYHYWPGRWGSGENSGAIPGAGLSLPFKPCLWLGWEEGGLSWFAESDEGWRPKEKDRCLEVAAHGDEVCLKIHLLDSAPPALPLSITFGFQATPVKPLPAQFHDWRICHGAAYGIEKQLVGSKGTETVLDRIARLGVKILVFHEDWTPIQNYWATDREAELEELAAECHKRGIKLLLYFGYLFSSLTPGWKEYFERVRLVVPGEEFWGKYHREPDQSAYVVCQNSPWQKLWIEGLEHALERYHCDGVYLDGTIEPFGCANERHGCGYRSRDRSRQATYPIFGYRQLLKQVAALVHARGGIVNAHQSTCCLTPTLSFVDSYWDGEQFMGGELAGDPLQKLPLATFRAEFMGKNFGVPCEFLVYEKPPEWTFDHALAFTLLHDVRVRPWGFGESLEKMSKIWDVMSDFGVSDADWYPYWRNGQKLTADAKTVLCSFYLKHSTGEQKTRMLLVVSNLSAHEESTVQIALHLRALQAPGGFSSACDAITGERVLVTEGKLSMTIKPMRARLLLVE